MGLFHSTPEAPLPPNAVINSQRLEWGDCYCGYTGSITPSWTSDVVNATLSKLNLKQQGLNEEIDKINRIALDFVENKGNSCRYYWWMGLALAVSIMIGAVIGVIIINPSWSFVLFGFAGGAILIFYIFQYGVLYHYLKIWNLCLDYIEKHIVDDLNERYGQKNIFWIVRKKKMRHGCGRDNDAYLRDICMSDVCFDFSGTSNSIEQKL